MNKKEQDMFDYLVHVEDANSMIITFSYIQLFIVMISKRSQTKQVVNTCYELN